MKVYDVSVLYNHGKSNVVADACSRIPMGCVNQRVDEKKELVRDVHRLDRLGVRRQDSSKGGFIVCHNSKSSFVVEVKSNKILILY